MPNARTHAAGIVLDRDIEKSFHFDKGDNFIKFTFDLGLAHAEDRAVQEDIFPSGKLGMKAHTNFQQTSHTAFDGNSSRCWLRNTAQYFQQGRSPRAIAPMIPTRSPC